MPVKRSRQMRSSSQGELSVFDRPPSPRILNIMPFCCSDSVSKPTPTTAAPAPASVPKKAAKSILGLGLPSGETSELEIDSRIGGFLKTCCFCHKRLRENDNVYMYRSVYAFCTPECRDKQIARDEKKEKTSMNHINMKGHAGAESGGATASYLHT